MHDISDLLKRIDPVVREPELDAGDRDAMRRIATTTVPEVRQGFQPTPAVVAVMIAFAIASGIAIGRQGLLPKNVSSIEDGAGQAGQVAAPVPPTRQLQFTTPGGTRIIWVFDPSFTL